MKVRMNLLLAVASKKLPAEKANLSVEEKRVLALAAVDKPIYPHSPELHDLMAKHHDDRANKITNNYVHAKSHMAAADLHRQAAKMLRKKHPTAHKMSNEAHEFTHSNRLY